MRLLVLTQIMDRTDPTLGFFIPWVEGLAERTEYVNVICLLEGEHVLPANVRVHSLGKETMRSPHWLARLRYIARFYKAVFALRGKYDAVLVHMNHEYVLLGGWYWRLLGKRLYMWRNHYAGSVIVDLAAVFCTKVFCTSTYSYTAKYKQTVIMPVGVNVDSLMMEIPVERERHSILTLGRITPTKHPEFLLGVYAMLKQRGMPFHAYFVGKYQDDAYREHLLAETERLGLVDEVTFVGPVANTDTFRYYRATEVFVNASLSGMLDKTMFKAMAAGNLVLSSSKDLAREVPAQFIFEELDADDLAEKLQHILGLSERERTEIPGVFASVVERNSLPVLLDSLVREMAGNTIVCEGSRNDPVVIDGRSIGDEILHTLKSNLRLCVISVAPNAATQSYLRIKERAAEKAGIRLNVVSFPESVSTQDVIAAIENGAAYADAVIVQLPVPPHLDTEKIIASIPEGKDADALSPGGRSAELVVPPVAAAVEEILRYAGIPLGKADVVVVGEGRLVGEPVATRLAALGANVKSFDEESFATDAAKQALAAADIVVSGAGVPKLITPGMVKEGVVLIDAGTSLGEGRITGDIDPACAEKARLYTPVPGGVGPVAVACLFRNAAKLAALQVS